MLTYKEQTCFLGRSLLLSDGKKELEVTLDVGPRIISFRKVGGENIMFNDTAETTTKDVSAVYGAGKVWHIYGGHRIWLSPEAEHTYYPDNEPVKYEKISGGAVFTPPVMKVIGVQTSLVVVFAADGSLEIKMTAQNLLGKTLRICIWALTVLKCGGELRIPLSTKDTGYLANRNIVLWPYNDLGDPRFRLSNDEIFMKSDPSVSKPYKVGTYLEDMRAEYSVAGSRFVKTMEAAKGEFPDYCCNVEAYMNGLFHEVETLSPFVNAKDGETVTHTEKWQIF